MVRFDVLPLVARPGCYSALLVEPEILSVLLIPSQPLETGLVLGLQRSTCSVGAKETTDRDKEGEAGTPWAGAAAKSNILSNCGLIFLPRLCLKRDWHQEQAIKQLKL